MKGRVGEAVLCLDHTPSRAVEAEEKEEESTWANRPSDDFIASRRVNLASESLFLSLLYLFLVF